MATTSHLVTLLNAAGAVGPGPAIELPGPKKDFGLFVTGVTAACQADVEYSTDGITWLPIWQYNGAAAQYQPLQGVPTLWVRANLLAIAAGVITIRAVYTD